MKRNSHRAGFTLVELLLYAGVLAIMALTVMSFTILTARVGSSNEVRAEVEQNGNLVLQRLSRAIALQHRITAHLRSAKAILAAERFRLDTGRLPKSLEELVPTYLDTLPVDPFTATPLRFAVTEEGIVIYSIGENLIDDGGLVARQARRPRFLDNGIRLHKPEYRGLLLIDDPPDEKD